MCLVLQPYLKFKIRSLFQTPFILHLPLPPSFFSILVQSQFSVALGGGGVSFHSNLTSRVPSLESEGEEKRGDQGGKLESLGELRRKGKEKRRGIVLSRFIFGEESGEEKGGE